MDEHARKVIAEARRTISRVDDAQESWAAENARRDLHSPIERTPPRSTQGSITMTTQPDWSDWDRWAAAHVQIGIDSLAFMVGEEVGKIEKRLAEKIERLETELCELKADRAVERAAVVDLPDFRRKRHDAA
jgi:hypothetical protein